MEKGGGVGRRVISWSGRRTLQSAPSGCSGTCKTSGAGWVVGKQFLRAATSVGANAEEAQDASSRKDFAPRFSVALREAREARYWLRIMRRTDTVPSERLDPLIREAGEVYAVIHAIVRKTRDP